VAGLTRVSDDPSSPPPTADIYNLTGKPVLGASLYFTAEADSSMSAVVSRPNSDWDFIRMATQAERGSAYATYIARVANLQGNDGSYPALGFHWWALVDNFSEKHEFGLVSIRDNAYDGIEARRATGTDPWGYPVGGEVGDYGDLITAMRNAHLAAYQRVASGN